MNDCSLLEENMHEIDHRAKKIANRQISIHFDMENRDKKCISIFLLKKFCIILINFKFFVLRV